MKSKNGLFIACFFGCEKRRKEYKKLIKAIKSDSNKRVQFLIEAEPIGIETRYSHILWDYEFEKEHLSQLKLYIYASNMAGFVGEKYQDTLALNLDCPDSAYNWFHRIYSEYSPYLQYTFLYNFLNTAESLHYDPFIEKVIFDKRFTYINQIVKNKREKIKQVIIDQAFQNDGDVLEFNESKGEFEHV